MKILIAPDSFKGSLSSKEVCRCIKNGIESAADCEITELPLADGGEGFGECMNEYCNGNVLYTRCSDIYSRPIKAPIFVYNKTAVIECAAASGLQKKKDVMNATSFGTGELIKYAVSKGYRHIILGLGGSGCCDGGAGVLAALGARFLNEDGSVIDIPCGKDLKNIFGVSFKNIVKNIRFTFACDVTNTLYGKKGAAYVFAPQKGATEDDVVALDNGLKMLNAFLPRDVGKLASAGAAGGICGGLYAVYGGEIRSGFDILAEACELENKIRESDLVITGEGKTDKQTAMGKLPFKIAELCKKYEKKCVLISGSIENGASIGDEMISLTDEKTDSEYAIAHAEEVLTDKARHFTQMKISKKH